MNCVQGDLAVYVSDPVFAADESTGQRLSIIAPGFVCRCEAYVLVNGLPGWAIEPHRVELKFTSGKTFGTTVTALSDQSLRPLRDSDGVDETLLIAGLPCTLQTA